MSFKYSKVSPTLDVPAPPWSIPYDDVTVMGQINDDGESDDIERLFAYRKANARPYYDERESTLSFISVVSVEVDGDERRLAERVSSYDENVEHVFFDGADYLDPTIVERVDRWKATSPDWTTIAVELIDSSTACGNTVTVRWDDELFGKYSAVWECKAELNEDTVRDSGIVPFSYLFDLAKGWVRPTRRASDSEVIRAMGHALTGYLVERAGELLTPFDADVCAHIFLEHVRNEAIRLHRKSFAPNMYRLVSDSVAAARPIPTGLDSLDAIIGGGLVPGVYVVAGDPGAGKTALAVQTLLFAAHQCGDDERVVYAMLDQGGPGEIAKRLVSLAWGITCEAEGKPDRKLLLSDAARWDDHDQDDGIDCLDRLTNDRAVLLDLPDGSVHQLRHVLDQLIDKALVRVRLLVLDYYQLLRDVNPVKFTDEGITGASVANDASFASAVMRDLRTWATDHGTPVLLVGQFTKESIQRHAKGGKPEMTDLLGSVDVPYQAESVIMLTNAHDGSGVVELTDAKHRHAGNEVQDERVARMRLDGERGYFRELDE